MYISLQTVVSLAAVLTAAVTIIKYFTRAHSWYLRQNAQDEAISQVKEEQQLLTFGVLACLKGLSEQGCDGPVSAAIDKIEKHLNKNAHR